ncbi:MAG: hypothetical protein JNN25_16545 [Candidatus Kapabacteria bacterium]|nr:hypothetical protein [Candidatus Kapabacteria bacterium]
MLYFALLRVCNGLGWKNPFRQSNAYLAAMVGISVPTLIRSRNRLQQAGLLEFESGKTDRTLTQYSLKILTTSFSSSVSSDSSSSVSSSEEFALHNTKHKLNNISPEKKNSSGEKNTQKSGKGAKSEKPESAARVKTHKVERNPLWMKHWADFQESYPKSYRTDWKKAEELFAELLHKDGLNDDETVGRRGRWLVTQAHFYGELCKYEHREEQFVKAADKWLADEDEYKRDYRKIIDAMPKNGRGSPMPEGMVL